ncbi:MULTISPECIES: PilX N-terminal domain-containing pilus assembly protein [Chitinibacter]|jgi:type IV pilus assembly protein PilX|uniref:pilus assembly PilX family protein n=1 Tax=Chitinibacter TaxID=230666 RepID=UPI0006485AAA|nr:MULTISPECIES: PilX N-terminal domain-containing pilus assembly protein [Chitinibacter]
MRSTHTQHGFVLITSIVFLVAITITVVYAVRSATLREHSAGNNRARAQAFEMAQLAMRRAQAQLTEEVIFPASGCSNGLCNKEDATKTYLLNSTNWGSGTGTCAIDNTSCNKIKGGNTAITQTVAGVAAQPRWAIRDMNNNVQGDCTYYEVWAQGTGADANSSVLLKSIVKACES